LENDCKSVANQKHDFWEGPQWNTPTNMLQFTSIGMYTLTQKRTCMCGGKLEVNSSTFGFNGC